MSIRYGATENTEDHSEALARTLPVLLYWEKRFFGGHAVGLPVVSRGPALW